MANLDSLNYKSISSMTTDEALELIRQIRLSRRIPVKKVKKTTTKRKQIKDTTFKGTNQEAAELLKLLTGG